MKKRMKSGTSLKFLTNHPGEHRAFLDLLKAVKIFLTRLALQTEEEQINDKLFDMIKNKCHLHL